MEETEERSIRRKVEVHQEVDDDSHLEDDKFASDDYESNNDDEFGPHGDPAGEGVLSDNDLGGRAINGEKCSLILKKTKKRSRCMTQ